MDAKLDKKYPDFKDAVVLLVLFLVISFAIDGLLMLGKRVTGFSLKEHPASNLLSSIYFLSLILLVVKRRKIRPRDLVQYNHVGLEMYLSLILMFSGTIILLSEFDNVFQSLFPPPEWLTSVFSQNNYWFAFTVIIAAPVIEEVFFRGILLRGFVANYSPRSALILSALFFAVFHFNPWQFFPAFFAGLALGWWVLHTKSIVPAIVAHIFFNCISLIVSNLGIRIPGFTTKGQAQPIWFNILGLFLFVLGICLANHKKQK
ncbi:MAG: CPBP family intramembrane metalloprotease [Firmicutes bacterium]|nr:CPBP family intramembrane metalloprotease [Bacillota bacterium]